MVMFWKRIIGDAAWPARLCFGATALSIVALAACSSGNDAPDAPVDMTVPCAIAGQAALESACRADADGTGTFTIVQPDGGFRRFTVDHEGVIMAADGAEAARSSALQNGAVLIELGTDRYRLSLEQLHAIQPQ